MGKYIVTDEELTSVADAIREKNGQNAKMEFPNDYIENIKNISGSTEESLDEKVVFFYDDLSENCEPIHAYTKSQFINLIKMPTNPDHTNYKIPMDSLGWTYGLSEAKAYITKYPRLDIGQYYKPRDNMTHFLIDIPEDNVNKPLQIVYPYFSASQGEIHIYRNGTEVSVQTASSYKSSPIIITFSESGEYDVGIKNIWYLYSLTNFIMSTNTTDLIKEIHIGSIPNNDQFYFGNYAFINHRNLTRVTLPSEYNGTMRSTFANCIRLKSITIPNSTSTIEGLCMNCYALSRVIVPSTGTSSYGNCFQRCFNLKKITLPDIAVSIGTGMFSSCIALESINIPDGVTGIGNNAFYGCSQLSQVILPNGITSIPANAFSMCITLESINIPDGVTGIGNSAFYGCAQLSQVILPNGITSIPASAFGMCITLESINIPDGVTGIGNNAFYGCSQLSQVILPNGITSIPASAFTNCSRLNKIYLLASSMVSLVNSSALPSRGYINAIYVPSSLLESYKTANNWSAYSSCFVGI